MASKLGEALETLKKLKSFAEDEAEKLTKRIVEETTPSLTGAFKTAHGVVDSVRDGIKEIEDFAKELKSGSNGGDPLDKSEKKYVDTVAPRSSELASKT